MGPAFCGMSWHCGQLIIRSTSWSLLNRELETVIGMYSVTLRKTATISIANYII